MEVTQSDMANPLGEFALIAGHVWSGAVGQSGRQRRETVVTKCGGKQLPQRYVKKQTVNTFGCLKHALGMKFDR